MSENDLSTWLTKREAAMKLGVAEKTLERMSKRRQIQQDTRKRRGTPGEVVYNPRDIERAAAQMPQPFVMPADAPAGIVPAGVDMQAMRLVSALAQAAAAGAQNQLALPSEGIPAAARVRVAERLFLTLDEAAEYSGLPKADLRRLLNEGKLGRKTGAGWRIRRKDLEKL